MARNNFQYEKRQRELDKKRKADDKAKRKLEPKNDVDADGNVIAQETENDSASEDVSPAALPANPA